jgi:hypothetical protein
MKPIIFAPRVGQSHNDPGAYGVDDADKYDWDRLSDALKWGSGRCCLRENQVRL